jgi:hypothetical protein
MCLFRTPKPPTVKPPPPPPPDPPTPPAPKPLPKPKRTSDLSIDKKAEVRYGSKRKSDRSRRARGLNQLRIPMNASTKGSRTGGLNA